MHGGQLGNGVEAIEGKRKACKKMFQINVVVEIRERSSIEYQLWNRKVKELVKESKVILD